MKKGMFFKWAILLPIAFSVLFGCAGKGKSVKTISGDPETLYKQGLAQFNKRNYSEALKKFEEIKASFPDSPPYTLWAELKVGDCHLLKKDYVEAIASYEEFKKIHPTHEDVLYVQYQIGMAYFNQMLTPDRDQTSTKKALSSFEYLIGNYPPGLFTEKAKEKIGVCKKRLADNEFYVGNFYYKNGKFQVAVSRFEELLEKFPKIPDEDKTLFLLGKSYLEIDRGEKAKETFTKIVNQYPKSSHYKEARAILDKGLTEKKVPLRKIKTEVSKKKGETAEAEPDRVALVKFEEEGKQPVSLKEEKKVDLRKGEERLPSIPASSESGRSILPKEETGTMIPPLAKDQMQEDRALVIPQEMKQEKEANEDLKIALIPGEERQRGIPPKTELRIEVIPEEEKRIVSLPATPPTLPEKEKSKRGILGEPGGRKSVDTGQPIDITSDRVETYSKDNLIIFKGNVIARQKDIVIYADSIEAVVIEGGKGIEKVIAGGNVKIQQGIRVASCQKAIFHNLDQKVFLTGDPRVWEGDNIVSGDEIVFDIQQNRVEVKGGPGGRGKAKIYPGGEFEKPK
jgi:outer membrane protein assembly factor BamD